MDDTLKAMKEDMLAFIDPGVAEDDIEHTVSVEHHNFLRWFDALDRLSAQQREPVVRVKELKWTSVFGRPATRAESLSSIGLYIIADLDGTERFSVGLDNGACAAFLLDEAGNKQLRYSSIHEAAAAAQADYEQRILSALEAPAAGDGEPVAWRCKDGITDNAAFAASWRSRGYRVESLYTAPPADAGMRWRHKKRGSTYTEVGIGRMQAASWVDLNNDNEHKVDMREVAIYRADSDGTLWVRPREEFEDGRFEALTAPGATTKSDGGEPSSRTAGGFPVAAAPYHAEETGVIQPTRERAGIERGMDQGVTGGESATTTLSPPRRPPLHRIPGTSRAGEVRMNCYIFDIDGTLADCSHRLHHIQKQPKDWTSFFADCHGDAPISHMIELAQTLRLASAKQIVFVSGRSDECRADTERWLAYHVGINAPLYMRKAGDYRDDDIIKVEILSQVRADGYEPIMAFDDRNRVVAAWRAAGVPCAQVAPGDF